MRVRAALARLARDVRSLEERKRLDEDAALRPRPGLVDRRVGEAAGYRLLDRGLERRPVVGREHRDVAAALKIAHRAVAQPAEHALRDETAAPCSSRGLDLPHAIARRGLGLAHDALEERRERTVAQQ